MRNFPVVPTKILRADFAQGDLDFGVTADANMGATSSSELGGTPQMSPAEAALAIVTQIG